MSDSQNASESPATSETSRDEHPSGWLRLTRNESVNRMIDALLDLPLHREFNQSELAELGGVSRQSVSRHLDLLEQVGVVEPVQGTRRFRFDPDSDVSRAIIRVDGAVNAAGPEAETDE
jgi:DNA-binding transcriptional ArsR family regulator